VSSLTTTQVGVRIAVIIASAELLIMLMFPPFPQTVSAAVALLDSTLLVVCSALPIYYWVIRPFVAARDEALARVSHLASTDPLTQLANRREVCEQLKRATCGGAKHTVYGALLLVDLDGFKLINDAYGHDVGDAVLIEIAQRLRSVTRSEDVAGRLGGDEFVVLVNRLDADERVTRDKAVRIAEKLAKSVNDPLDFRGKTLHIGASIGIRLLGFEELDADRAIREADLAMYDAKQAGRGHVVLFERQCPATVSEIVSETDVPLPCPADQPRVGH
jgi:diguanylate cyclase (GGDEF)-like protein